VASDEQKDEVRFKEPETLEELSDALSLLGNLTRLRVIAALLDGPMFVQELSSKLAVSYPLLHLHLKNMEKHGLVRSEYAIGTDKSKRYIKRYFQLVDFKLEVTPELIRRLASASEQESGAKAKKRAGQTRVKKR